MIPKTQEGWRWKCAFCHIKPAIFSRCPVQRHVRTPGHRWTHNHAMLPTLFLCCFPNYNHKGSAYHAIQEWKKHWALNQCNIKSFSSSLCSKYCKTAVKQVVRQKRVHLKVLRENAFYVCNPHRSICKNLVNPAVFNGKKMLFDHFYELWQHMIISSLISINGLAYRQLNCSWPSRVLRVTRTMRAVRRRSRRSNKSENGSALLFLLDQYTPILNMPLMKMCCNSPLSVNCFIPVLSFCFISIIKNKEALSDILQDFKYDSEEPEWNVETIDQTHMEAFPWLRSSLSYCLLPVCSVHICWWCGCLWPGGVWPITFSFRITYSENIFANLFF